MNKRGTLDWFIVSIIIAILTLVVFVLVAIFFPYSETIDRSSCEASLVLRAAVPGTAGGVDISAAKDAINKRCKTQNICVTAKSGKGNCTQLGKNFETKRLTGTSPTEQSDQIKMFLSREMADCWEMFGEGKLQIFSREFSATSFTSKGIICDKIEFDNSVLDGKDGISGNEDDIKNITGLMLYMVSHKVPNNNYSYMDYLRGTAEGQSAQDLYGPVSAVDSNVTSARLNDNMSLEGVKAIFYLESTLTNFAQRIGGGVGATVGAVGAFYTKGLGSRILVGGGFVLGSNAGESIFKSWFVDPAFCNDVKNKDPCRDSVGGLMITNYTSEGFSQWKIDSFENL